jgi:hypothetical protein
VSRARGKSPTRKKPRRWRRRFLLLLIVVVAAGGAVLWPVWHEATPERRIAGLERTRDALLARLAALRTRDPIVSSAPAGDLAIGVPESVGAALLGEITTGFLRKVTIDLHDLRVHKSGRARIKTLFGRMSAGAYALDVRIHEVRGTLEPGKPKLHLSRERAAVEVPVSVVRGEGRATLAFRWDSRGIGNVACEDFAVRMPVTGRVLPRTYSVKGGFDVALAGDELLARPRFPAVRLKLAIEPSAKTWEDLDRVLGKRSFRCRAALKLVDVPGLVRGLLDRGIGVTVPQSVFRPLRLPAGLERNLTVGGRTHALQVTPREVRMTPSVLWYAADVRAE